MTASRSAMSIRTTSVSGSADLCEAMQTNIVPRTFSVGWPHVVVSSTSGRVRPMAATGANGSARLATLRVYAERPNQRADGVDDHFGLVEQDPVAALRGDQ